MTHLVHVVASPSGAASRSRQVAEALASSWQQAGAGRTVDVIDVWALDLPVFGAEMIAAKFAVLRKQTATPAQQALWRRAVALSERFNAAQRLVFSVPMWNFGVPYRLKHFIDVVTLPEQNWRWSPRDGYEGLLPGRRAVAVYSSAGDHRLRPHESEVDHQKGHLRAWLAFLGITDVAEITVAPTLAPGDTVERAMAQAKRRAGELAVSW